MVVVLVMVDQLVSGGLVLHVGGCRQLQGAWEEQKGRYGLNNQ